MFLVNSADKHTAYVQARMLLCSIYDVLYFTEICAVVSPVGSCIYMSLQRDS